MDGDKKVGLCPVGYLCTLIKFYEDVILTRVNHFHIATIALYIFAESKSRAQVDILLF